MCFWSTYACIVTNFIHRHRRNMEMEVAGVANGGAWDDDESDDDGDDDE